jgi:hypothetical protein
VKALKKFGRDLGRMAWSKDWFDWFLLTTYVLLGVLGGVVATILGREFQ